MARSQKQKLKLLYLMQYLTQHSDEAHPVGIAQMVEMLAAHGILAERKSLYGDLEALREFGLDIVQARGKTVGYYVGTREFELPELKLLVDSVQSSKFITQRKTLALIRKIESLASVHDAVLLQRQVYVRNRVKSMNESVYYNVDEISSAITADKKIRFLYFEYTVKKERRYRRDGAFYELSPYALMWDDENYYMLAYDAETEQIRHYRVDKMTQISTLESFRDGREAFKKVDMSAYTKKVFGMFAGEAETVRLRFSNHLAGAVIDRFGRDVMLIREDDEHFSVSIEAVVSPQFYAWVFGFGTEAEILSPAHVRDGMADVAASVLKAYRKD
ncbi:MAG: WYL domain-containing protein [Oscillospiraceae bacterium]|nr:WYL domain-containing protein [Oscillospiraceae bacterium]MBR0207830.1 WYL domain-containing protein [Oscillospiraceae bacterium]